MKKQGEYMNKVVRCFTHK